MPRSKARKRHSRDLGAAVAAEGLPCSQRNRRKQRLIRLFQRIAGVVLLLYRAVPVLALKLAPNVFPGIDVKAVCTMEVMLLVALLALVVGLRRGRPHVVPSSSKA